MRLAVSRLSAGVLALAVGACAHPHPGNNAAALRDPYEKTNRSLYNFNRGLDKAVVTPATKVYRAVIPTAARNGVSNGFSNLGEPTSFINAVLQGKIKQAFRTVDRFLINTVLGVGGLADHATSLGRPEEDEDFGQTLAVWGVNSGPYLMLPFLGPSTLRDAVGFGVDTVADPIPYARNAALDPSLLQKVEIFGGQTLDLRSRLVDAGADGVLASSLDEYATVKSAYLQRRQSDIYDGAPPAEDDDAPVEDAPLAPGATPPRPGSPPPATPVPAAPIPATPVPPK